MSAAHARLSATASTAHLARCARRHVAASDVLATPRARLASSSPRGRRVVHRWIAAAESSSSSSSPSESSAAATANDDAAAAAAAAAPAPASDRASSDADAAESPEMHDNLANIFLKRDEEDWIGLLASSARWPTLRAGFFARLKTRATEEADPEQMLRLSRLLRLLRATSERVDKHEALLAEMREMDEDLWEGAVTSRRDEFTTEFFQLIRFKLEALIRDEAAKGESAAPGEATKKAAKKRGSLTSAERDELKAERAGLENEERAAENERDALARLASTLLSICEAFDLATKDQGVLEEAAENFKKLLEVETLEEMNDKIDQMAAEQSLNPALVLTAAKAYMSVKESPYVEEEVKDVMAHLYFKMKETMGRQQPKVVRILKYLLSIEDPKDVRNGLEEAFTPGPEIEIGDEDYLFCEAPELLSTIDAVLKAYDQQKGKANITGQAAELMTPEVIEKMKTIKFQIEAHFM